MISIQVKMPNLDGLLPTQKQVENGLRAVAAKYLQLQTERINRGRTVTGQAFRPYHQDYRDAKTQAGRMGEGYWLRLTGKMLRSQKIKFRRKGKGMFVAEVGFTGTRARSRFKQRSRGGGKTVVNAEGEKISNAFLAEMNDRLRPFVGINRREAKRLTRTFTRVLKRSLR